MSVIGLGQVQDFACYSVGVIIVEVVEARFDTRYRIMAVKRFRLFARPWLEPGDTMTVPISCVLRLRVRSDRERQESGSA